MDRRRPSIYDLATEVGVSSGTVSRALNDRPEVSAETRRKILEAAERLGFVASPLARGLARQTTAAIGIVIPGVADPFFGPVAEGIQREAQNAGYAVMISNSSRSSDSTLRAVAEMLDYRVSGIVVCGGSSRLDSELASMVKGTPTVVALRKSRDPSMSSVFIDHCEGARLMVRHLLQLGRTRITFVGLDDDSVAARERLRGFREEMRDSGLMLSKAQMVRGGFTASDGMNATAKILRDPPRAGIDAIFYATDLLALAGQRAVLDLGISVPGDIAIAGFGDIAFASLSAPGLTTVGVDKERVGAMAAAILCGTMASDQRGAMGGEIEVSLIARESTLGAQWRQRRADGDQGAGRSA